MASRGFLIIVLIIVLALVAAIVYGTSAGTVAVTAAAVRVPAISVAEQQLTESIADRAARVTSLSPLRKRITAIAGDDGQVGVYVEDLSTRAWIGVNEGKPFVARSLIKTYLLIAILQDVEDGKRSLTDQIPIMPSDRDSKSGSLFTAANDTYTLGQLLTALIVSSDNTAARALERQLDEGDMRSIGRLMGPGRVSHDGTAFATPRSYGRVLRGLHNGAYLSPQASQYALSLLSHTGFGNELAGGTSTLAVAHKVGTDVDFGIHHDCGIVYAKRPYVLCVMTENLTTAQAATVTQTIGTAALEYFNTPSR